MLLEVTLLLLVVLLAHSVLCQDVYVLLLLFIPSYSNFTPGPCTPL